MYADTAGEFTRKATRLVRREDMRLFLAHILRATAHSLPPDHLLFHRNVAMQYCKFITLSLQVILPRCGICEHFASCIIVVIVFFAVADFVFSRGFLLYAPLRGLQCLVKP
jgi:hypothetical protein